MRAHIKIISVLIAAGVVVYVGVLYRKALAPENQSTVHMATSTIDSGLPIAPDIVVTSPKPEDVITSPLVISGKAKGNWFFEATFPMKLVDGSGAIVAQGPVQAQGDWQTTDFVNFTASLPFTPPATATGTLIFS